MIRVPYFFKQTNINVFLKNGENFMNKDVTNNTPQGGKNQVTISFWHNGKLRYYPISEVSYWEYNNI